MSERTSSKLLSNMSRLKILIAKLGGHSLEVIPGDLALAINNFVKERPRRNRGINIDVFVARTPFRDLVRERIQQQCASKFWIIKKIIANDSDQTLGNAALYLLDFEEKYLPDFEDYKGGSFIVELGDTGFCFISRFRQNHHRKVASKILSFFYPGATKAFLTSREMYKVAKTASETFDLDLRVRQEHSRASFLGGESSTGYHERPPNELPTVDEIFKVSENMRSYLTMCKLISANPRNPFEITFSGAGHIGLYEGGFEQVFGGFINPMMGTSSDRIKKFSQRSMSETPDRRPRPIIIDFQTAPFEDKKDIQLLVKHIQEYTHCNYSMVHSGNPHLFMYLTDTGDFSTFSVRTMGSSRIVISPQIVTSPESMVRFTDHLLKFSKLGSGEIDAET